MTAQITAVKDTGEGSQIAVFNSPLRVIAKPCTECLDEALLSVRLVFS